MCVLRKRSPKPECTDTNPSESNESVGQEVNSTTPVVTSVPSAPSSAVSPPAVPVDHSHSAPSVKLVTRYIGRGSKNIPSRALKRQETSCFAMEITEPPTKKVRLTPPNYHQHSVSSLTKVVGRCIKFLNRNDTPATVENILSNIKDCRASRKLLLKVIDDMCAARAKSGGRAKSGSRAKSGGRVKSGDSEYLCPNCGFVHKCKLKKTVSKKNKKDLNREKEWFKYF